MCQTVEKNEAGIKAQHTEFKQKQSNLASFLLGERGAGEKNCTAADVNLAANQSLHVYTEMQTLASTVIPVPALTRYR